MPIVEGYDEATAALSPEDQAEAAAAAIAAAPGLGLYGYYTSGVTEIAVASTTGLAVSQAMTDVSVLAPASEDSSGYAEATSWRASDLDLAAVAREAAKGRPDPRRDEGRAAELPRGARAVRDLRAPVLLRLHLAERARPARGAQLPVRAARRKALRRELHRLGRGARPAQLPEVVRPRGRPEATGARDRGRSRPRRGLGPPHREAGRGRPRLDRPRSRRPPRPSGRSRSTSRWRAGTRRPWTSSRSSSGTAST